MMAYLKKAVAYMRSLNFSAEAMRYIVWYAAMLVICCTVYMIAWFCRWKMDGKPDLQELRAFLHEIASSPWVAAIGFIGKALVDRDGDGIPDDFEHGQQPPVNREEHKREDS